MGGLIRAGRLILKFRIGGITLPGGVNELARTLHSCGSFSGRQKTVSAGAANTDGRLVGPSGYIGYLPADCGLHDTKRDREEWENGGQPLPMRNPVFSLLDLLPAFNGRCAMTVKVRKVSEEEIHAQRKQVKEQESLRTAEVDSAVDKGVNSPAATKDEDWQEYEQPDYLKRGGDQPFKLLKPWRWMLEHNELAEETLVAGSFLSNEDLRDKYKHTYLDEKQAARLQKEGRTKEGRTIEKSTLFWYPAGVYNEYPTELYGREQREIAGVYLQGVIRQEIQDEALAAMKQMSWSGLKRPETKTAKERQAESLVAPRELTIGVTHPQNQPEKLMPSVDTRKNVPHLLHLIPLWKEIARCYQKVLPAYFRLQNSPGYVSLQDPRTPAQPLPDYGGIPRELRNWLGPANSDSIFSTVTLLQSCPASVHKDNHRNYAPNMRGSVPSLTTMVSLRWMPNESGPMLTPLDAPAGP